MAPPFFGRFLMWCTNARLRHRRSGLVLCTVGLVLAEEAWVRILMPADGSQAASRGGETSIVDFDVSWGGMNASGIQLCVQLTNKRLCVEENALLGNWQRAGLTTLSRTASPRDKSGAPASS